MIRISRRRETTVEQILGLEVGKKSKRVGQCLSVRDPGRNANHLNKIV